MGVVQVDHIVQIDAGQNGEDEGLEEGHQELQSGQGDHHAQRQGRDREGQQTDAAAQAQKAHLETPHMKQMAAFKPEYVADTKLISCTIPE